MNHSQNILIRILIVRFILVENIPKDLQEFVSNYAEGSSLEGAKNCLNTGPMMYSSGFNSEYLSKNWKKVLLVWVKSLDRNWQEILYSHMCSSAAFLPPLPINSINPFLNEKNWHAEWLGWGSFPPESAAKFGLSHKPIFLAVERGLYWWRGLFGEYVNSIAWPGLLLTISGLLVALSRKRNFLTYTPKVFLLLLVSRHFVLSLVGTGLIYRYGFMTHLVSICLAVCVIIGFNHASKRNEIESTNSL